MVRQESLSLHTTLPPTAGPAGAHWGEGGLGPPLSQGQVPPPGGAWEAVSYGSSSPGEVCLCWDAECELVGRRAAAGQGC